jgi:hypothetical protein
MKKELQLELVFWLFTALVTIAVLIPINSNIIDYPFWIQNIVFIIVAITITRYIFLLKFTFLAKRQLLKVGCIFLCIPLIFYLVQELNYFQTYLDERGTDHIVGHLPFEDRSDVIDYMRSELLLFGTMAIISSIIFPIRLIISIWRTHNRGTV